MPDPDGQSVAGIRLASGELVFVEGVPQALEAGDVLRCVVGAEELLGSVCIPPRLVMWRDPEARCAKLLAPEPRAPEQQRPQLREPIARFIADGTAPDTFDEQDMLDLAWREMDKLDR